MESNLNPDSWNAALLSAGAGVQAVDKVIAGEWDNAFCAVRPPGHHSTSNQALGFCMFNNIAITAACALKKGLSKILIVDWDVHHGNGTQDIFYRSSQVFFYSMHQHNLYPPFSGQESDDGEGEGEGFTLNRPLKPGTPGNLQVEIFIQDLEEITRSFHPQLVLISCGFDSCDGDLLGSLKLEKSHYAQMTAEVLKIVPGKVISFLEGGYNLQLIGDMFGAHFSTLMGKNNAG
jgi:acetoin utilization deacetylase AcuC-like enzyme